MSRECRLPASGWLTVAAVWDGRPEYYKSQFSGSCWRQGVNLAKSPRPLQLLDQDFRNKSTAVQ